MKKSVKEHFDDCREVSGIIDNANALLTKCQGELATARAVLEELKPYQHELHQMSGYTARHVSEADKTTPTGLIDAEVSRINKLLGDRA